MVRACHSRNVAGMPRLGRLGDESDLPVPHGGGQAELCPGGAARFVSNSRVFGKNGRK
jgi:hypothetical protein